MKLKLLLIICMAMIMQFSYAQNTPGAYVLEGNVIDSLSQKPLTAATLYLKSSANKILKNGLTQTDGSFVFENVATGNYSITIVNLGYTSKTIPVIKIDGSIAKIDLGSISLSEQSNVLATVSVTGNKPLIKQEIDRIAYDMQADPESKTNNVLDMMRKVPLLSLDADENIQLKGSGSYKILVNGKPSAMLERNAKEMLRGMSASNIKSIEVITDPPAKYDSEGLAGIINIITTKRLDNGYNANLSVSERFPGNGPQLNGGISVKQGKLGINPYGSIYSNTVLPAHNVSTRVGTLSSPTNLVQDGRRGADNTIWFGGLDISYEMDSLNLIAVEFATNGYLSDGINKQSSILTNSSGILQGYDILSHNVTPYNMINMAVNYQLGFKSNKNRFLTFSYRYANTENDQTTDVTVSNKVNFSLPNYNQTSDGNSRDQTFQMDYVHPLKKVNIEAGIKGIIRDNESDFKYSEQNTSGQYIEDPTRSNKFDNMQSVFSAYNSYLYALKSWSIRAGLRLEETVVDADFMSSSSTVNRNYFNFIPNLLLNKKFKNLSSISLGFTQRIERPIITTLNPFIDRQNPSYESAGNPNLRPSLSNNFNLSYSRFKKLSLSTSVSYSFANNTIQRISIFNPSTNITSNNYDNIGKNKTLSSFVFVSYPITKAWNFSLNSGLSYAWFETAINGVATKNEGLRGNLSGTTGYRFNHGWRANGSFGYVSPNVLLQGRSNALINSSLSVSKEIVKEKLTFSGSVSNPFTKFRTNHIESSGVNFFQINDSRAYYRTFSFRLDYRFGKLKEAIKKNKRGINNDDVASGG